MSLQSYEMIAIDLDGTLLGPDGRVHPRTRDALHAVLDAGVRVCFATGRNFTESAAILRAVDHHPLCVFVGGAVVIDTDSGRTLQCTRMRPDLARALCELLERHRHAVLALQDTTEAGLDYLISASSPINHATDAWMRITEAKFERRRNLGAYAHPHTIRVGVVAEKDAVAEARSELMDNFADRIVCHSIYVPAYGVEVLEAFDPRVNKWDGICRVAKDWQIDPEKIIAVGDDINDLPMIRNATLGVAMGNATAPVKEVADRIIGSNADNGLAEFLEELVRRG